MNKRHFIYAILSLGLLLSGCRSAKTGSESESGFPDLSATHIGGSILREPKAEAPEDLYQSGDVEATDAYMPFTKKLPVYGLTLIGRDDITDDFMRKVEKTVKAMFPREKGIDRALQEKVLCSMYKYKATIPMFKGHDYSMIPSDQEAFNRTMSQTSICDIIMEGVQGQAMEVVEHILHHVTDVGLHYTFPEEWGVSTTSKVYQAMQEAIDKGYYVVAQYGDMDEQPEVKNRVLIQEFAYWVITSAWDLQIPFGPDAEWKGIKTPAELKAKLPQSYALFEQTIPKVMAAPSREHLTKLYGN